MHSLSRHLPALLLMLLSESVQGWAQLAIWKEIKF